MAMATVHRCIGGGAALHGRPPRWRNALANPAGAGPVANQSSERDSRSFPRRVPYGAGGPTRPALRHVWRWRKRAGAESRSQHFSLEPPLTLLVKLYGDTPEAEKRYSPAMAAGVSDTLLDMAWIVGLLDARVPKPNRPKVHRTRQISNRDTTRYRERRAGDRRARRRFVLGFIPATSGARNVFSRIAPVFNESGGAGPHPVPRQAHQSPPPSAPPVALSPAASAGATSVRAKSSPLKSRGSPVVSARA